MQQSKPQPEVEAPTNSCRVMRSELEGHLRESKYGVEAHIFTCFFVPGSMPPRCVACQRLIAEHNDQQQQATAVAIPATTMGTAIGTPSGSPSVGTVTMVTTPLAVQHDLSNINIVTHTRQVDRPALFSVLTLFFIGLALLMIYGATGLLRAAPVVMVGPSIMWFVALLMSPIPKKIVVTFDKAQRLMTIKNQRLCYPCVGGTMHTVAFDRIRGVVPRSKELNSQKFPMMGIMVIVEEEGVGTSMTTATTATTEVEVDVVSQLEAYSVMLGWQQYLTELGFNMTGGSVTSITPL